MRVKAVWKPHEEWGTVSSPPTTPGSAHADTISHFTPTGEPDAPYESYGRHI